MRWSSGINLLVWKTLEIDAIIGDVGRHYKLILIDNKNILISSIEIRQILLMDTNNKRHEVLIGSLDEMEGQVVNEHMLPL